MPEISGLSHLTLTVKDVERSTAWWNELIGLQTLFEGVEEGNRYSVNMHPCGLIIGFRQGGGSGDERFDEDRVGLDHFAFHVADRASLEEWAAKLDELGIAHSGIKDVDYGSIITFRDPDNLQAEFFTLPAGS